ncbi:hypothetical protein Rumeso_00752 [Rubellimicrobium mesophilum DSM 19309]|uniref:DUF6894 domain-containing protein n=2 Tax=Rubellimicrobium TaxID=295418 RepID=A0A017HT95_9RHOB|nr:hypothetical protein Rumeso_00752 [Rubellimicrobium mesophilum DSM 19309]
MSCYHFHMEGHASASERVEMRLDDPEEARAHTIVAVGDMLRRAGAGFWNGPEWQIDVTDETGRLVCTLTVQGRAADAFHEDWAVAAAQVQPAMASVA